MLRNINKQNLSFEHFQSCLVSHLYLNENTSLCKGNVNDIDTSTVHTQRLIIPKERLYFYKIYFNFKKYVKLWGHLKNV